jgi:glycosyltransferase involved in cell wall biosynthesis
MAAGSPTTVAYVAWAPFFSGAERALLVLAEHVDRSRYQPIAIVGTDGELADELRSRGIRTFHVPIVYSGARRLPSWAATVARLAWILRREGAAIVHSNDVPSYQPAGYAARLLGLPALTHVRFPDSRAGFEWFLKPGFRRALFVSRYLREDAVRQASHMFSERSEVVYDGVAVLPPVDEAGRLALRRELGLPLDRTIVVLAGQVAEVKGIWDFIDAAQVLRSSGSTILLTVLGDDFQNQGALRREAEQAVNDRGLNETVRFLGFRANAQRLIPAFDIVAVPSHVEPLGNATLEAMASARPVVGSRVGGIPEMVVDGVTGTLVPSRSAVDLAAAIASLAADPARALAYGRAGRQRVADNFSVDAHVTHAQRIYDRALAHRRTRASAQ